ncbi:hypothetical protein E4T52_16560 [Aureobasidium sp. EXF-3400]|nr:hypothetical protein E4T51_15841 [Aureobasidium sp. EXF-12344]KAI4768339.1 hypothetical protein E4T52_16560 [Aureobasidium sp. EXF-3400]
MYLIGISEQKIDRMEQRLESIEKLLQLLASTAKTPGDTQSGPSSVEFTPAPSASVPIPTPQVEQFEGESSLVAHSRQAHEALQHLLEAAPTTIRNDPNTVNALAALRNLLEKHRSEPPSLNLLSRVGSPDDLQHSELPPRDVILKLFAHVEADDLHDMFTWWLFDDVQDFYKMYDEFCHSPSTCPLAISILVYCALCWLLEGNPVMQRAGLNMSEYAAYVPICHRHLATCISSYNLFLDPTDINIAALSSAAAYAIYTADINAAWTLTSTAARLCQSLGYHRLIPDRSGDTKLYEKRAMLFWSVYFIDKSLSLRLGRSSALQDFDISTSAKDIFDIWSNQEPFDYKTAKLAEWLSLSLEMAKIQGAIYDKLYAPGSIKALSERQIQGQEFIIKIHEILSMNQKCFAEPGWLQEYTSFYKESSDVILYSLFTLVYRAMPEVSNAQHLSLQAARSTMQVHYSCSKKAEFMGSEFKLEYMTWSIMLCPFTSFIVLFRNVVTDLNIDDLKLLEDFVASIEWLNDKNQREPLQRFQQLCHAFYNLAKHFVAARLRADHEHRTSSNAGRTLTVSTMQQTTDFDQSLSDVAFPEDFQTWMDTNMDFMNDNWLAFGTL